eukprot:COSAG05_NODE_1466_length_4804_cov_1.788523_6_plen_81_part_00
MDRETEQALTAVHLILSKWMLAWRDVRFRPYARGVAHPSAAAAVPLLVLSPLATAGVTWLVFPSTHTILRVNLQIHELEY